MIAYIMAALMSFNVGDCVQLKKKHRLNHTYRYIRKIVDVKLFAYGYCIMFKDGCKGKYYYRPKSMFEDVMIKTRCRPSTVDSPSNPGVRE